MKKILVAGIGNAWLGDDGFGGEVVKRLEGRELPEGVVVFDFGTGGLDLAYEVMRGYDALLLIDISRQGEEPGTLYVMEASKDDGTAVEAGTAAEIATTVPPPEIAEEVPTGPLIVSCD